MIVDGVICLGGQLKSLGRHLPPCAPPWIKPWLVSRKVHMQNGNIRSTYNITVCTSRARSACPLVSHSTNFVVNSLHSVCQCTPHVDSLPNKREKLLLLDVVCVAPIASSNPNNTPVPSDSKLPVYKGLKIVLRPVA